MFDTNGYRKDDIDKILQMKVRINVIWRGNHHKNPYMLENNLVCEEANVIQTQDVVAYL